MSDVQVAAAVGPPAAAHVADVERSAPYDPSISAYLASAERMYGVADVAMKVGIALVVLLLVAWVLGVLPGATRLF